MQERHRDHQTSSKVKIGEKKGSKLSRLPKQHDTTRAQPDHDSVQINSALKIKYFRLGVTRTEAQTTKAFKTSSLPSSHDPE